MAEESVALPRSLAHALAPPLALLFRGNRAVVVVATPELESWVSSRSVVDAVDAIDRSLAVAA
jgi:hypothetical protein